MTTQSAATMQRVEEESVTRNSQEMSGRVSELYGLIARRAFEIFERRGATPGHEREDWVQAESELLGPVLMNVADTPGGFLVQAEVPGFGARDIEVSVEPRRLVILGERETRFEVEDVHMICSEAIATRVLRSFDLPSEVDAEKTSTALKDGVLTIYLPKLRKAA